MAVTPGSTPDHPTTGSGTSDWPPAELPGGDRCAGPDYCLALIEHQREQIAELTAANARLLAEADLTAASYNTILSPTWHIAEAMEVSRGEEPGTIMRETDGQHREYVLGDDQRWRPR